MKVGPGWTGNVSSRLSKRTDKDIQRPVLEASSVAVLSNVSSEPLHQVVAMEQRSVGDQHVLEKPS